MAEPPASARDMPAGDESPAALGACLRDMVVLLALPSMCHGQSPREVLEIVAEVAAEMLHLDLVYVRLGSSPDAAEAIRMRARPDAREHLGVIRRAIAPLLEPHASDRARLEAPLGGPDLNVLIAPVGFYSDGACIVLGASRATFPSPLEVVLLRATASLAGAAIENAKLLQISRDADRRKDEFLALLGHELRNPLAPILTALQLLELKRVGGEKERAIIERQVQHMIQLVNDLLDISRVTKGKLQLNGEPTQISGVVQRALELASPAIEAKRHSVSVDVAPRLRVHGDPLRLAQVFGNLLTNAAKFTEPGGRIELRGRREGSRVVLSVRDSGRGIDPAMQERIFEPFVQADRDRDTLAGGLGLGLAIVRSLVGLHGGTVRLASAGRGLGSEFTVELPALDDEQSVPEEPSTRRIFLNPTTRPRRVLVVDDNADAAQLIADGLRARGDDVRVAGDGLAAIELARSFKPDAAFIDIGLPVMDGYAVASQLRNELGRAVILVAVSGYAEDTSRRASVVAGFDAHLVKPVSLEVLAGILDGRDAVSSADSLNARAGRGS